jgi:hypothetical protein
VHPLIGPIANPPRTRASLLHKRHRPVLTLSPISPARHHTTNPPLAWHRPLARHAGVRRAHRSTLDSTEMSNHIHTQHTNPDLASRRTSKPAFSPGATSWRGRARRNTSGPSGGGRDRVHIGVGEPQVFTQPPTRHLTRRGLVPQPRPRYHQQRPSLFSGQQHLPHLRTSTPNLRYRAPRNPGPAIHPGLPRWAHRDLAGHNTTVTRLIRHASSETSTHSPSPPTP